jgi:hypothetical protein
MIIVLLCCPFPAWGTIGFAEWQSPTPNGNMIGNTDSLPAHSGTAIYQAPVNVKGSNVYVKNIRQYGFYEGAIIGEANGKLFWFDETTKVAQYFTNQAHLCSAIATRGLKFYNNLTFFPGSHHYDYYGIRYSLYFLIPFLILVIIHCLIHRSYSFPFNIDRILRNNFFGLQLYSLAVFSNIALINHRLESPDTIIFHVIVSMIVLAVVGIPLWGLSQFSLQIFRPVPSGQLSLAHRGFAILTACLKCLIFLGIFMRGLSLTIGKLETPWTSIHYFFAHNPQFVESLQDNEKAMKPNLRSTC